MSWELIKFRLLVIGINRSGFCALVLTVAMIFELISSLSGLHAYPQWPNGDGGWVPRSKGEHRCDRGLGRRASYLGKSEGGFSKAGES